MVVDKNPWLCSGRLIIRSASFHDTQENGIAWDVSHSRNHQLATNRLLMYASFYCWVNQAKVCIEANNFIEAYQYIRIMSDSTDKVKLFVASNRWPDAIQTVEAMRADPGEAIEFLEIKCKNATYLRQIQELRERVFASSTHYSSNL